MPIAKVQLEDGRIARFEVPEGTTQEQVLQFAQEMNAQSPVSAQNSPLQGIEQELNQGISPMDRRRQIITELSRVQSSGDMSVIKPLIDELSSISENTGGGIEQVVEPLATIVSSVVAEPIAGLAGIAKAVNPLAEQGAGAKAVESTREALTYKPRTQAGQAGLNAAGEVLQPVGEAISSVEGYLGDTTMEATGSPALAAAMTALPTLAGELTGLGIFNKMKKGTRLVVDGKPTPELRKRLDKKGLSFESLSPESIESIPPVFEKGWNYRSPEKMEAERIVRKEIEGGSTADGLAKFKVEGGMVVNDIKATEAVANGFTEGLVQSVKMSNSPTKAKMNEMLDIMVEVKKNERKGLDIRPSDVVGDSVMNRIDAISGIADSSRIELDRIARKELPNLKVDPDRVVNQLSESLGKLGISYNGGGVPDLKFKGSDISKDRTSQRVIRDVVELLGEGGKPDALRMHKLKRQIDKMLDYRASSFGGLTDAGKSVAYDIRKALNDTIRDVSPSYAEVNDKLSLSLGAIEDIDKSMGSIDISGIEASTGVGSRLRALLSNQQGRAAMQASLNKLESATETLDVKFDDDLKGLVMFADALDSRYGTTAKTSLAGQQIQAGEQLARQAASGDTAGIGINVITGGVKKAFGKSDFDATEAMRDLLSE
jgi:hypothetical protein